MNEYITQKTGSSKAKKERHFKERSGLIKREKRKRRSIA